MFEYTEDQLRSLADEALRHARSIGATDAVVELAENTGLNVNVRKGKVETIEKTRDKSFGVTVYVGQRRGHASSSDFAIAPLRETVDAAFQIARFTAEDDCAGLPDAELLARHWRAPDMFHPWSIDADAAIALACEAEDAAFATSPMVRNSDGASVSAGHGQFLLANSRGFAGGYPYSRHSLSCVPIAQRGREMQRDGWYSADVRPDRLADAAVLGRYAAERSLARLGARRLPTGRVPVLFESPLAIGLIGHLVQALSGGALYRQSSFLLDSVGQQVFPSHVDLMEDPSLAAEPGSAPFDSEGVRTSKRRVVDAGVIQGYFLSTYSARKLGLPTTGNAGGSHNLRLRSRRTKPGDDLDAMLRRLGTGLFVTDLMGQGVNYVTGDYSRGAGGYWVENGVIAYPVEEITIAGNLRDMFAGIVAIGADEIRRGAKRTGSILVEAMAVAGT
ncbi:MAG: metalloprotease PmbA [Burkholderiaceae bacterium]